MDDASKLETIKQYLRRKYASDLAGLKTLADTIAASATESVTLTGQTFEGSSHQGVLVFASIDYLAAIEAVIMEIDPSPVIPPPSNTHAAWSYRPSVLS